MKPTIDNFGDPLIRQFIYEKCNNKLDLEELYFLLYYNNNPIQFADMIFENHLGQIFKERWENAKILVIGANYQVSERIRWEQIDPNYIGLGFRYKGDEIY